MLGGSSLQVSEYCLHLVEEGGRFPWADCAVPILELESFGLCATSLFLFLIFSLAPVWLDKCLALVTSISELVPVNCLCWIPLHICEPCSFLPRCSAELNRDILLFLHNFSLQPTGHFSCFFLDFLPTLLSRYVAPIPNARCQLQLH